MKKVLAIGVTKGEICNRDGCKGIIDEYETDESCSCHINPPCSVCVDDRHYCPECDWQGKEDQRAYNIEHNKNNPYVPYKYKTEKDLDNTKIDYIKKEHTHFTMRIIGVYPKGTSSQDVQEIVKGSFGGRFIHFGGGRFEYIAYTD